jgi:hypothetical protein
VGGLLRRGHDRHVPADHPHAPDGAAHRREAHPGERAHLRANALGAEYGRWLFYIALFIGFLILFDTQLGIFEALVRNMTDAVNTSPRLQQAIAGDPRRFYYPFMFILTAVIGLFLQFFQPATLVLISANMSNLGALIFPFVLMYLNSKLPKTARPRPWVNVVLVLNFLFFGFFFVNFVFDQLTGRRWSSSDRVFQVGQGGAEALLEVGDRGPGRCATAAGSGPGRRSRPCRWRP